MLETVLTVVYILICIAIVILVLMQEGKSGLSSTIGGGESNSYWGKNKDRAIEGTIPKATGILVLVYMIISILLNMV